MEYTIVIEKAPGNYAAWVPDLPGCVATGATRDETIREIGKAIALHIESLREHGELVPSPQCTVPILTNVACAVERRFSLAGSSPARQLSLQLVAIGADYGGNDIV